MCPSNGDTDREWEVAPGVFAVGIGSFHKSLRHNDFGEVERPEFEKLVKATRGLGSEFKRVPKGPGRNGADAAALTNPQGGLAADRLTHHPAGYAMLPAPKVDSIGTAAEMTELYWMALLRDCDFAHWDEGQLVSDAASELDGCFARAVADTQDVGHLRPGIDLPGSALARAPVTPQNLFRLGLPGEEVGPLVSQFFLRDVAFGTQTIDQMQRPYKSGANYLTEFADWKAAQDGGQDKFGKAYPEANEYDESFYEPGRLKRYISTPRDLARFVNKDALHQAYFNAALILLSGAAKWTPGNPYSDCGPLKDREAGFGVLGGPHILALVSEVATRALKVVWNQKWQVHLRLRPEAYGGLVHVQTIGANGAGTRAYGLPEWVAATKAAMMVKQDCKSLLLPMAYSPGSPTHPAYGAGHATVAGACVTVLKAYFQTFECDDPMSPLKFTSLKERSQPFGEKKDEISCFVPGMLANGTWGLLPLDEAVTAQLTIEGELNKLAQNVAMGRSMGGVHWRSDNARSLILGEAIAAEMLADITRDANEYPEFTFRTFARKDDGEPKHVVIKGGRIFVDGNLTNTHMSAL
ncbi:vanadium-dependent haloperoxidase [Prosthecodimorpha staleyi]|uniref:Vanadium-dependent haloperoxidase n=1 Tax=Prosthecodimorpha staleyi TaxID=2840188 RepID=A0A947D599_9HYPH|nr:vanadium-dependent haloperoxidase [Prosthecodimorpha staleyi]MBT9291091.1 vanadium-dependent haloperoxidase [Prosthecodimorpha staleyi]